MVFHATAKSLGKSGASLPFRLGVGILLLFYVVSFVYSPVGVPHVHHEGENHHGDACQTDACHISVYHPGIKGGCNHKSHLTSATEECDLCHTILPRQVFSIVLLQFDFDIEFASNRSFVIIETPPVEVCQHADRGPPATIS